MRILISITPRMYREVLTLSIHRCRPDFEMLLAPPRSPDGRVVRFRPHVLVQDADEAKPPSLSDSVVCRVLMRVADRVDTTIELDGTTSKIHDVRFGDLLGALEKAEELSRGKVGKHFPTVSLRSHLRGHR